MVKFVFLRKNRGYNNRVYLTIARGFRENGKSKQKHVANLGYLDELEKQYDDPIAHFKEVAKNMTLEKEQSNQPMHIKLDEAELLTKGTNNRKNYGYAALSKIYHELEIDKFLIKKFRANNFSANKINSIMKLLVFSRALYPDSKKYTYDNKDLFFENFNFSLKEVYNSLTYLNDIKTELQRYIYTHIQKQYGNNTDCVYYDVTNYYFEIDDNDDFRKKGVSKEHRPNPIVQMGLFMDSIGLPMTYKLFEGNTNDCLTLPPMIKELKNYYNIGKVIVVADKGLNTGDNVATNILSGNGYVMSLSIRGSNKDFKDYVLDENGYISNGENHKIKSRLYPREILVTSKEGAKKKVLVDEKQVIFYSRDYDKRAKAERQPAIEKAKQLIDNPIKYNKANSHGASKYVKHLVFDKKTGEIVLTQSILSLNEEKLREEEKYDGYYAIVTSEYKKTDDEIIEIYRGLWRIEETFKITKSDLETRPIYLSRKEHIESHFLTCYIALVLSRILQYRLNNKYSISNILQTLSKCCCSHINENLFLFDCFDDVLEDLEIALSIDFSKKFMRLAEIKKNISNTKKI